ncbi:hypothetical protein CL635_00835 [bacterium]|nr:hypothetical protein [bacterium]|tara:strand:- start:15322 stop:15519 length:198 start_codon:yes stop_codon:yes gene_type:complete
MSSSSATHRRGDDGQEPLSTEECRQLLGRADMSDKEIEELLNGLRGFLSRFLDDYFKDEFAENDL